jgi:fructokinase
MRALLAGLLFEPGFLRISDRYPTGSVSVQLDNNQNPQYQIRENVAWDYIRWSPKLKVLARKADAVCFGSLAQRGVVSRATIRRFLDYTRPECLRVFDINLREPYPDPAILFASLERANVVKLNTDELEYMSNLLHLRGDTQNRLANMIQMFDLFCIALTRGAEGSLLVSDTEAVDCPGLPVHVQDTVGAGDAFTAAVIMGLLMKKPLREINTVARRIAAFVCTQMGAMVDLPGDLLQSLRDSRLSIREYRGHQTISADELSTGQIIDRDRKR